MPDRPRKATRLTVSLDHQDYAALESLARKSDVSLSWVIRQAVHRFVTEHEAQPELPLSLNRHSTSKSPPGGLDQ